MEKAYTVFGMRKKTARVEFLSCKLFKSRVDAKQWVAEHGLIKANPTMKFIIHEMKAERPHKRQTN
jgi:hypothetical protein